MNLRFIDELSNYIKDNKLFDDELKHVYISNKFLPYGIKKAIINRVKETMSYMSTLDNNFEIMLDNNNELCLRFTLNSGRTNIILKNGINLPKLNFSYTIYPIEEVMRDASYIELRVELYDTAIESLSGLEKDKTENERIQKASTEVDRIMKDFTADDIIENAQIEDELERVLPSIKEYIVYCYNYTKDNYNQVEDIDGVVYPKSMAFDRGIDFVQRKSNIIVNEDSAGVFYLGPKERVNEIINYDSREELLFSMHPIMVDYGNNEAIDQVEYKCLLYKTGDNEYKFLFEPFSGKKATKIISFKYSDEMNYGNFCRLAELYLEMSEQEVTESIYGIRIYHTKEEVYNNVIKYAILKEETQISQRIKDKIVAIIKVN